MRIMPLPLRRYPWYLRPFFRNQRRKYGAVLESALLWGHSPKLFLGVALLYGVIDRRGSPLEPALRSLITVRVSHLNGCRFCVDLNSATLLKRGVPLSKVDALGNWYERNLFNERERVALEFAETITVTGMEASDDLMERVRHQLSDDGVVELTALIAFQNMSSKFNGALGVPPQGFCILPGRGRMASPPRRKRQD